MAVPSLGERQLGEILSCFIQLIHILQVDITGEGESKRHREGEKSREIDKK